MVDVVRAESSDRPRTECQRGRFYDDGFVQVWHGDARALPLPDGSVQLIVTSPPYDLRNVNRCACLALTSCKERISR
jgi:hypothetical protein